MPTLAIRIHNWRNTMLRKISAAASLAVLAALAAGCGTPPTNLDLSLARH
jgi:hypothetical protein